MSKPTFRVSPSRRPVIRRLTPVAWVLIGVVVLALGLLTITAVMVLEHRLDDGPWQPTPTVGPTATATPLLPTATPTEWWDGLVDPTADPTPPYPAWWSSQMTQDEEGNWWPPDEVIEMVRQAYWADYEATRRHLVETTPPDYEAYEGTLREWVAEPALEGRLRILQRERSGEEPILFAEWETCILQVQDFSLDGLLCTLGLACSDGLISQYDSLTGQPLHQESREHGGLALIRMRYDSSSGHWQQCQLLEFFPPDG